MTVHHTALTAIRSVLSSDSIIYLLSICADLFALPTGLPPCADGAQLDYGSTHRYLALSLRPRLLRRVRVRPLR